MAARRAITAARPRPPASLPLDTTPRDPRPRFAYWIKGRGVEEVLLNVPERIRLAWPNVKDDPTQRWCAQAHPQGGTLLIFPAYEGQGVNIERDLAPGRPTHDGMVYYPSLVEPTMEFLIRPEPRPAGKWVDLHGGLELFVATAYESPRRLILKSSGSLDLGSFVGEFAQLAFELHPEFISKKGVPHSDPRIARLLFLTIRQSYWMTEEQGEDWGALSDIDINPICCAAMGLIPKPSAGARPGSRSPAPTTSTSP